MALRCAAGAPSDAWGHCADLPVWERRQHVEVEERNPLSAFRQELLFLTARNGAIMWVGGL